MRDCPTPGCTNVLADNAIVCNACGWEAPRATPAGKKAPYDPLHGICEHVDRGERCAAPAGVSASTHGSGPRYCYRHFPLFVGRYSAGGRTPPPNGFEALRALTKRVPAGPVKPDYEAELEREAIREEPRRHANDP